MNLCPSEKWGATSCFLVLHWYCPNFVLPQLVSTKDRAAVIMVEEISIVSGLVQLTWAKHRVQCGKKNKVLKNPPGMGGCHRELTRPSYVCHLPLLAQQ